MTVADFEHPTGVALRRVSWGAIFAGTVVAMALMVFFTTLGIAIGAATVDPLYDREPASGLAIGSGIYIVLTQILSLAIGGFVAARLANVQHPVASVLHGVSVWALATLLAFWAAVAGGGALLSTTSSAVGSAARGAGDMVQAALPDNLSLPDLSDAASRVSIEALPPELQQALQANGMTPEQVQAATRDAFADVVSEDEQSRALEVLRQALSDALASPGDIGADLNAAMDRLFGGPDAVFSDQDRAEVSTQLQNRLRLTPQQADQMLASIQTNIDTAVANFRQGVAEAEQRAREMAQSAASAISTTATWLTIASLLGLAAAAAGAAAGRPDGPMGDRLFDRP